MIFFTDNSGNIIKSIPSPVYQGSANTNTIYLIAPFAVNSQVTVAFKLPNGAVVPPVAMSQQSALQGIKDEAGRTYAGWTYAIPNAVTRYYGVVTAQFFFYAAESGVITATASVRFVVNAGVPAALPDTPDEDVYESILGNIASLQERLNSGYYVARAVFPWNEGATYGTNEITFYPGYGEYGAFVMSLQEGNTGNLPYSADGTVNSAWWKPIADFNALADLAEAVDTLDEYVEQAKQAAEDAQESADAAATSAASAASSARMAGLAADDAQQSAAESAQSALESKAYMEQAREYAQKEYQLYDSYADLPRPGDPAFIYLVPNVQSLEYVQKVAAQLAADGVDVSAATERELYAAALAQPIADEGNDSYIEYLWVTNINDYERIGSVNDIDLSEYAKIYGTYPDMTVGKANQLVNARKISVDLASSSPASFDGTKDVAAGVTGILPVANGGTGADDLMDIKVGDSVHADTANDPNAVHFTEQTLTDEQKLQARKNISAAAEEQALKNMYNLGAYDTFTDNGDGTVTVTRKTYTVLDYASLDWHHSGSYGSYSEVYYVHFENVFDKTDTDNMLISNNSKIHVRVGNEDYTTRMCDVGLQIIIPKTIANGDVDVMKAWLNEGGNIIAQIPLATSYTEEVILDQPIHTLDVNGEKFVRDEWEKGLNLCQVKDPAVGSRIYIGTVSAGTYSICLNVNPANSTGYQFQLFPDASMGTPIFTADIISPKTTFTVTETTDLYFYANGKVGTFSVMLNAGSNIYPYQPYNGKIVHEKELDDALEDYLPRSGGTVLGNLNVNGAIEEAGERVYSPNNPPPSYANLPSGGFEGDVLAKRSDTNYDCHWVPPTGGGGSDITVTENADGTVNIVIASSNSSGG